MSHDVIIELLQRFSPEYFCLADEIATTGTMHTHVFIYSPSPIRFSTLKNRFPTAHIEKAYGSARENREYITKTGKWADDSKSETTVKGSFYEFGELPKEQEGSNLSQLIEDINEGMGTAEIVERRPNFAFKVREIETLRQTLLSEQKASEFRQLEVTYIFGATGTGKTRSIYKEHPAKEICRITNYRQGKGVYFDAYHGQNVLVFEEFFSQIPIEEMLNYLDIYPLLLPARYNDKIACYTKVYITSNVPLESQYLDIQKNRPQTWQAFLRRIDSIVEYKHDGIILTHRKEKSL